MANLYNPITVISLFVRSQRAIRYARVQGILPGLKFDHFGRRLGYRLLLQGAKMGMRYILHPVSIFRYFEFSFCHQNLPNCMKHCLDVSSPNLFSLYVAQNKPACSILMINPDRRDIVYTSTIVKKLKIENIDTMSKAVDMITNQREQYDCIWSISVIEHISGKQTDTSAVKIMYNALRPGGRLLLTFPVDRSFRNEYRDQDYYDTQDETKNGKYFFQRIYDEAAIWERILNPINQIPVSIRWFGETTAGTFLNYEERWMNEGLNLIVNDPREIVENYQEFSSWKEMPGMGVCGIMIQKPQHSTLEVY